ncbi:MAG: hypothetical protein OEY86_06370 [Nitrospira sp.]|nr:hypothetical protein [Nitrospira sp.]
MSDLHRQDDKNAMTHPTRNGKGTLFMVEDQEKMAMLITLIMQPEGHDMSHAADGRQTQKYIDALPSPVLVWSFPMSSGWRSSLTSITNRPGSTSRC